MSNVFPIGTEYTITRKGVSVDYVVVDHWITRNAAGEIVKFRHVCARELMGQKVLDRDVVGVTIAKALAVMAK
jgi:hypothetical protein